MRKMAMMAAALALMAAPAMAAGGGACFFNGTATLSPPIGSTPVVCTNPSGCQQFQFSGSLTGAACLALTGSSNTTTGKFFGPYSCSGNVHGGSASTSVGTVSYNGVCAGALCTGVAYKVVGGFQYDLAFSVATITNAIAQCPTDDFSSATFTGAAVGGTN